MIFMNNQCDRLNLLDFNKWNCLILLCGAIKLIISLKKLIIIIIIIIIINHNTVLETHLGASLR